MAALKEFKLGTCTTPCGKSGEWEIANMKITKKRADHHNLQCLMGGDPGMRIAAGTIKKLMRVQESENFPRAIVMSNTPMEINSNREAYNAATGRVIINGLGMGMILEAILSKPDVTYVRVIEISQTLIDLVGPHFADDPRVEIICADALTYKPEPGETFDYAWHDIWDCIDEDNLPQMATLGRKYSKRICSNQGVWSRDRIRAMNRSYSGYW